MSWKRCDTDTTGAERNGALGGDGDGLPTDEGQTDERIRKASREAGEEDSSGSQSAESDCVQSTGAGEAIQRQSASVNFTLLCAWCGLGVSWARLVGPGPAGCGLLRLRPGLAVGCPGSGAEHQGKRRRHGLLKKPGNCRE
jgi:hypothetical protein